MKNAVLAGATPVVGAGGGGVAGRDRIEHDREAQPESDAFEDGLGEATGVDGIDVGATGQVVAGHVGHGSRAQEPGAVQLAAVRQHLQESLVVGGSADQTGTPGEESGLVPGLLVDHRPAHGASGAGRRHVQRRQPLQIIGAGQPPVAVGHSERLEDALLAEVGQGLAGDDFDDPAEHIGGDAVAPSGARLEQQRQRRPPVAHLGQVAVDDGGHIESGGPIHRIDRRHVHVSVGQTGGVRQQMPHPDRRDRRDGDRCGGRAPVEHPGRRERRNPPADFVGQLERTLLPQHHRGDRRDRLGHRVDPPQRVVAHRRAGVQVQHTIGGCVADLAVPADADLPAGQPAVIDVAGEVSVQPSQLARVETDLVRVRGGFHDSLRGSFRRAQHRAVAARARLRCG